MENGYRFHLLNITVWTLACDLMLCLFTRPYPLFPMHGACYVGIMSRVLVEWMGVEAVTRLNFVSFYNEKWILYGVMC